MKSKHLLEIFQCLPEIRQALSKAVNDTFIKYRLKAVPMLVTCTLLVPVEGDSPRKRRVLKEKVKQLNEEAFPPEEVIDTLQDGSLDNDLPPENEGEDDE